MTTSLPECHAAFVGIAACSIDQSRNEVRPTEGAEILTKGLRYLACSSFSALIPNCAGRRLKDAVSHKQREDSDCCSSVTTSLPVLVHSFLEVAARSIDRFWDEVVLVVAVRCS